MGKEIQGLEKYFQSGVSESWLVCGTNFDRPTSHWTTGVQSLDPLSGLKENVFRGISERDYNEKHEKSFSNLDKNHADQTLAKFRWKRINQLLYFTFGCVFVLFFKYIYE